MARLGYVQESYLKARAFLQRYETVGEANADSLLLGYRIERSLGDQAAAGQYRQDLLNQFPDSAQANQARQAY